jgi:hypothetical protein
MQFEPKPLHIHQNSYKTLQKLKKNNIDKK